ncbi:MAG TPA: hypothetical protein VF720_04955, partial [Candidatus Eisenbacteria bacterium]
AYELLAGRMPFDIPTDSLHRAIVVILTAEPRPLSEVRPDCRGDVEYIVQRLLEKSPSHRYSSAREVADDLGRVTAGHRLHRLRRPVRRRGSWGMMMWAGVAAVVLGVGAIGWIYARPLLRPERVLFNRSVVASVLHHIADGGLLIHADDATEAVIRQGIARLDSADVQLQSLPGTMPLAAIRRLLFWRRGEAHYFLGAMKNSKAEFGLARVAWERAWGQWNQPWSLAVVDSSMEMYTELLKTDPSSPIAGMVLVEMALAGYEQPKAHLLQAHDYANLTWKEMEPEGKALPWQGTTEREMERLHGYCMTLNNLSFIKCRIGWTLGDTNWIAAGLPGLLEADARWPYRRASEPRGAHLHNLGRAYRYRGVLTGSVADLDSAEAAFVRALDYRTADRLPRGFAATQFERARTVLDRPAPDHRMLEKALRQVRMARTVIEPFADILEAAEGRLVEAELVIRLADRQQLAEADSLIREAGRTITVERFPLQHVDLLRVSALLHEAKSRMSGESAEARMAAQLAGRAVELTSSVEEPFRYRRLVALRSRLESTLGTSGHLRAGH